MGTSAAENQGQGASVSDGVAHTADDQAGVLHAAGGDPSAGNAGTVLTVDDVLASPDRARALEFVHHVEQQGGATGGAGSSAAAGSSQPSGASGRNVDASGIPAGSSPAATSSAATSTAAPGVRSVTVTLSDGTTQTLSAQQ